MSIRVQTSFKEPMERVREVLRRASEVAPDDATVNLTVSGGTDSVFAADVVCEIGPEYGLEPDVVTHINTGAGVPQSRLVAKIMAEVHGLGWIEQGYRNEQDALAVRVLENGWPASYTGSPQSGGHGLEWANRKDKPMDEVYMLIDGQQVWVSGARRLESKNRQGNVPDTGVERDKPRRLWCSPIVGLTDEEKRSYIVERGLPVSEAYLVLGFSGECTACSFDERGLLTNIDLLSPELAHALRTLAVWLFMRVSRGDVDLDPKRLCWGWEPDVEPDLSPDTDTAQAMVGCDDDSCSTVERPEWVRNLPDWQIVDREDVLAWWGGDLESVTERFAHLSS